VSSAERQLGALRHGIERCRKCRLGTARRHAVPGEGPSDARIMVIGEAPGASEDASGKPFCGAAGDFLDELLETEGLARGKIFLTSSVKCRPPGNRRPRADELETCREAWLLSQIEVIDPDLIILFGRTPVRQLLKERAPLRDVHGQTTRRNGRTVMTTYHPAAGMRFPEIGEHMRRDLAALRRIRGRSSA